MENKEKCAVLIAHNYYQNAGGEDSVVENERKMLELHGHNVIMYTKNNKEIKTLAGKLKFLFSFLYSKSAYRDVKKLIKENKIGLVHVHNTFPLITTSVYAAAHDAGVPVVQTLHNFRLVCPGALYRRNGQICEECNQKGLLHAIQYGCYRNSKLQTAMAVWTQLYSRKKGLYDKVGAYIALTEFNKRKFETSFPWCMGKVYVKPNFIGSNSELNSTDLKTEATEEYLYIGRLSEEKGIHVLLEAFAKMPRKKLCLIGTGPLITVIKAYINEQHMENVKMLGHLTHEAAMKRLYQAKALIFPSVCYETFGMTIIEAFSCGIPVIGSRLGNMKEIINDNKNGLLFDAGNVNSLIETIRYLESNSELYQALRTEAWNTYLQNYTEEKNYDRLLEIYEMASQNPVATLSKLKSRDFL